MRSSVFVVAVLAVARPSAAIFQDLLLQPLQHFQHIMQPQPPQPQYYQYQQYRRSSEPQPLPAPVQPVQHGVYANSRPVVYQWQPNSYGSAYSYGGNPLSSFLQNSWFPWASASRQPLQQQPQPLSAGVASSPQQQQPQQPLQAFWAFLPWNSNMQQQQPQQPGPILSFLQNPSAMLPWGQQHAQRPGVVYTSPLAPSSIVAEAPVSASLSAAPALQLSSEAMGEAAPAGSVKPTGVVLDDIPATAAFSGNGIRRIALHDVHPDALPCAQDAQ